MKQLSDIASANNRSQNVVFKRIFLVITISIFIPISIMTLILGNFSNRHLMQQVDTARNEAVIKEVRFFEQKLEEVDALVNQLLALEPVSDLVTLGSHNALAPMNMKDSLELFHKNVINNDDLHSIYLYNNRDTYVLSDAKFNKENFQDQVGIGFQFDDNFYVSEARTVEDETVFSYVRKFYSFDRTVESYLVMNLHYDPFWASIFPEGANTTLSHTVTAYGDKVLYADGEASEIMSDPLVSEDRFKYWQSEITILDGTFTSVQPVSELNQPVYLLIRSYALAVVLTVILALGLAYIFSNRLYRPLRNLINKIKEITNADMEYSTEYQLIDQVISYLISENIKVSEDYEHVMPYFERHSITDLIEGNHTNTEGYNRALELLKVKFSYSGYYLLLCEYSDEGHEDKVPETLSVFFDSEYISTVFTNVGDGRYLIILNTEMRMQEVYDYTKEVHSKLQSEGHNLTISLGDRFKDFKDISNEYQKVLEQLEYKFFAGTSSVLHHMMSGRVKDNDLYNRDLEAMLLDAVKKQDSFLVHDIMGQISDYHRHQMRNISYTRYMYFILGVSIVEQMNRFGFSVTDMDVTEDQMFEAINGSDTLEAMDDYITEVLDRCIELFARLNAMQEDSILQKVKTYMENNYHKDLSLEMIASSVYLSTGYLSTVFKAEAGITVFDYLTNLRMEKAKELLIEEKKMKVQEVARRVGYNNSQSFIRHFKKHYNITPGGFRK